MYTDRKKIYIVSVSILAALLFFGAIPGNGRISAAVLLALGAFATMMLIRKRGIHSYNKRQVLLLVTVVALMALMVFYISGFSFGFSRSMYPLTFENFLVYILPITTIIVSSEIIRCILRWQNSRIIDVFAYMICLVAEILTVSSVSDIRNFHQFMDIIGITVLPAVTANILYHYLSGRYGAGPVVVYRLILSLYIYIIPFAPSCPDSLHGFAKLVLPLAVYIFISGLYEKKKKFARHKKPVFTYGFMSVALVWMLLFVMLISNQFSFGSLVIATESMTGALNKGDAVVFRQYEGEHIGVGDIIVFERNNALTVHRVTDVKNINGQLRYFTKGDANETEDTGFVISSDIVGLVKIKIPYMGYPSLWLRGMFK